VPNIWLKSGPLSGIVGSTAAVGKSPEEKLVLLIIPRSLISS